MKRRYLYLLVFSVPALLAALAAAVFVFGVAAGVMWLFISGDDPWPKMSEVVLGSVFGVTALTGWAALLYAAFFAGRSQEGRPGMDARHMGLAVFVTLLLIAGLLVYQRGIGNVGPRSDSLVCADYCIARGFAGSSMPPRNAGAPTCSCVDSGGREVATVPLQEAAKKP